MLFLLLTACLDPTPEVAIPLGKQSISITSVLQKANLCGGISPDIRWAELPENTEAIAVTLIEPSTNGPWVYWMAWNIPPTQSGLPTGVKPTHAPPTQGINSNNAVGYSAPCPTQPADIELRVFALDAPVQLPPTASWGELGAAIQAHTIAWGRQVMTVTP